MNGLKLFDLINGGAQPVATFHDSFEDMETCIDDKMVGRLVGVERVDAEVFILDVDLNDWEEDNDKHAKTNYYDRQGQPEYTAKQAGCYPKNGVERVYLGYDQDLSKSITVHEKDVRNIFTITITDTERDLIVQALWLRVSEGQADDQEVKALVTKLKLTA
jgi:hypothetical protein